MRTPTHDDFPEQLIGTAIACATLSENSHVESAAVYLLIAAAERLVVEMFEHAETMDERNEITAFRASLAGLRRRVPLGGE